MEQNTYWQHSSGLVAKYSTPQDEYALTRYGWTRINRETYRKAVRARTHSPAHDTHATGEAGNEMEDA